MPRDDSLPVTTRGSWHLEQGDCLDVMQRWAAEGVVAQSCITDPPFNLKSIAKRFGSANAAPAQHGRDGAAGRLSRGFMGHQWDDSVAMRPETWAMVLSLLAPGARLLAFGGTRTWHRMACAIEDAGFEVEDTIVWAFGQGLVLRRSRMKPGWSPIVVARRPGPVRNFDIEGCRVAVPGLPVNFDDRWPANLLHDGDDEVLALFPDSPGQLADASATARSEKTNTVYGRLPRNSGEASAERRYSDRGCTNFAAKPGMRRADSGSAARFYNTCPWTQEDDDVLRLIYHGKVTRSDKVYSCNVCGESFMHGSMAEHQHERDDWKHVIAHPTQKPVSLLRHLVRLVTPPSGIVLEPFGGTGTTCAAAITEGFDCLAVERETIYCDAFRKRMLTMR